MKLQAKAENDEQVIPSNVEILDRLLWLVMEFHAKITELRDRELKIDEHLESLVCALRKTAGRHEALIDNNAIPLTFAPAVVVPPSRS
jgi:hypothetical protein